MVAADKAAVTIALLVVAGEPDHGPASQPRRGLGGHEAPSMDASLAATASSQAAETASSMPRLETAKSVAESGLRPVSSQ